MSYILRRGASYYARLRVPIDLAGIVGKKELVKALGTKDRTDAKRLVWPIIEAWNREFDELRARRQITADDKEHAIWDHYWAALERDEANRASFPTEATIDAAKADLVRRAEEGKIANSDPLTVLDASLD